MTQSPMSKVETRVRALMRALEEDGKHYPSSVKELQLSGIDSYSELLEKHREKQVFIYRTVNSPSSAAVELITPDNFWMTLLFGYSIMFGIPILCIILALASSLWWILGILVSPFGIRVMRNSFARMVIDSALHSEPEFCLLYNGDAIRLMDQSGNPV